MCCDVFNTWLHYDNVGINLLRVVSRSAFAPLAIENGIKHQQISYYVNGIKMPMVSTVLSLMYSKTT